ncbi:hypothetical protein PG993_012581 [Apiospora rasikravindrae]|uniref:Uncharacterized protein n=1 Tax=Apiospora rasikravindrae TaxID=990691 RepID=A0ABR1S496_9PEZI
MKFTIVASLLFAAFAVANPLAAGADEVEAREDCRGQGNTCNVAVPGGKCCKGLKCNGSNICVKK